MVLENRCRGPDTGGLTSQRSGRTRRLVVTEEIQGELKAKLFCELFQPEDLACPSHVRCSRKGESTGEADEHPLREDVAAPRGM